MAKTELERGWSFTIRRTLGFRGSKYYETGYQIDVMFDGEDEKHYLTHVDIGTRIETAFEMAEKAFEEKYGEGKC